MGEPDSPAPPELTHPHGPRGEVVLQITFGPSKSPLVSRASRLQTTTFPTAGRGGEAHCRRV